MNRQPVLEGERLLLRPLKEDDWQALFAVASDRLIWEVHPAHDRWQKPVFRAFFDDALANGGAVAVIDKHVLSSAEGTTSDIIGSSRWQGFDPANGGSVEIGWTFLARSHWGGRFNPELKALMIAHALQSVDRVVFRVGETNGRSRAAMEKIGGRLTDEIDYTLLAGSEIRHVIYEVTKASFAGGPLAS